MHEHTLNVIHGFTFLVLGDQESITNNIDPEYIRSSLREFSQKHKEFEKERDEALAKVSFLEKQIENLENERNECEERMHTLQKNLQDTEEGKSIIISFVLFFTVFFTYGSIELYGSLEFLLTCINTRHLP